MLRILKWLAAIVGALLVIAVAGSFLLPGESNVSRSIEIAAPPEKVFAIVGSMKRFNEFSPWAELDPNTKYAFEGPDSGAGQKMSWTSENANVGTGSQTVVEVEENKRVVNDLEFGGMGTAKAGFELEPAPSGTKVTWTLKAPLAGIVEKWMGILMFNRWIGADYEKGLAKLKALAEKP